MSCNIQTLLADSCAAGLSGMSDRALREALLVLACELTAGGGGSNLSGAGSPMGVTTPTFVGQYYLDTVTGNLFVSVGATNVDWQQAYGGDWNITFGTGDLVFSGLQAAALNLAALTTFLAPQLTTVSGNIQASSSTTLVSASFPALTSAGGWSSITANTVFTTLSLPVLTTITGSFSVRNQPVITSISLPALTTIGGLLTMSANNAALVSVSAPLLTSVQGVVFTSQASLTSLVLTSLATVSLNVFSISSCPVLPSLSLPSLVTAVAGIGVNTNASLVTVSLPVYLPTNGQAQNFTGCALTQASVDHILARCVANAAYVSGTVTLSGGTNSTPSAAGLADKATLVGRGVTVLNN